MVIATYRDSSEARKGDRVKPAPSMRGASRTGTVTDIIGEYVRVRWDTGRTSTWYAHLFVRIDPPDDR